MKHLKTYEQQYNIKKLEKYAIYCYEDTDYYIDHIIEYDSEFVIYQMMYKCDLQTMEINKSDVSDSKSQDTTERYVSNVIFTSDDLNKCQEYLKLYVNSKKYNI